MFEESFATTIVSIAQLLLLTLMTPINQRPFRWEYSQADKFVYDAWDRFASGLKYNIGSFILYTENGITYNYDGQSRLTTSILFLYAAREFVSKDEQNDIDRRIFLDKAFGSNKLTPEQQRIKEEHKWNKFPRIQSYYKDDFIALGNCLNGLPYQHVYIEQCVKACKAFLQTIPQEKISDFLEFFLDHTQGSKKDYKSPVLAAKDMDIENNRGRQMSPFDNARNILIITNNTRQYDVSRQLDLLRKITKGLETVCLTYLKTIVSPEPDFINETVTFMTRREQSEIFVGIVNDLLILWPMVKSSNVFKLLDMKYKELVWNVILPVALLNKLTPEQTIELARKALFHCVRNGIFSSASFGPRNTWCKAAMGWIQTKEYTLPEFKEITTDELYKLIHDNQSLPPFVLRVYCERIQSTAAPIIMDNVDIEHIIAKKTKQPYINNLGNLTLLERKNQKDILKLKGNRSLKDKPYSEKKNVYEISSVAATRDVVKVYPQLFGEEQIEERGKSIVSYFKNGN